MYDESLTKLDAAEACRGSFVKSVGWDDRPAARQYFNLRFNETEMATYMNLVFGPPTLTVVIALLAGFTLSWALGIVLFVLGVIVSLFIRKFAKRKLESERTERLSKLTSMREQHPKFDSLMDRLIEDRWDEWQSLGYELA